VFGPAGHAVLELLDPTRGAGDAVGAAGGLVAPMPGKLMSLLVSPGQAVRQGQALAVMEAMKMEHTISAPRDGVVAEWLHAVGDQVAEGAELLKLEMAA
jgi:3-methylcrotonyl-CoA carboxylase alpha subunit